MTEGGRSASASARGRGAGAGRTSVEVPEDIAELHHPPSAGPFGALGARTEQRVRARHLNVVCVSKGGEQHVVGLRWRAELRRVVSAAAAFAWSTSGGHGRRFAGAGGRQREGKKPACAHVGVSDRVGGNDGTERECESISTPTFFESH